MTTSPDGGDEPDESHAIDAAFDEIVANIDGPGSAASSAPWPEAENTSEGSQPPPTGPTPQRTPHTEWSEWDDIRIPQAEPAAEPADDDEGTYVPPPPPPLPKGDRITRWGWAGAVGAPLLAILLTFLGQALDGLIGIALVGMFLAGFITLITRLRQGPSIDDGPDDGAVV